MKKTLAFVLALVMVLAAFSVMAVSATAKSDVTYSDHMTYNSRNGYIYDITGCSIVWVKQANGALIWVSADDTRSNDEIIAQAKAADGSLTNGASRFTVLKGDGIKYTPNTNGSKAMVTVFTTLCGVKTLTINGAYSHCVKGVANKGNEPVVEPEEPVVEPEEPTEEPEEPAEEPEDPAEEPEEEPTVEPEDPAEEPAEEPEEPVEEPEEETAETVDLRVDTALKMAVKFEDGEVYYNGDIKQVVVGKEYLFQICSVNWDNGVYDDNGNGLCGTVVYRMKVVHKAEFEELRKIALQDPDRYTVKGMDIIDNDAKTIIINCDAGDFHLETDVNNFFVAYRFHFVNGDYNKQTGIANVVNTPLESLSVNLPLGTTVQCDAYAVYNMIDSANVLISRNNGEGIYEDVYLTSVNDYYWNH